MMDTWDDWESAYCSSTLNGPIHRSALLKGSDHHWPQLLFFWFPWIILLRKLGFDLLLFFLHTVSVVIPKEGTETWWTFLGLMDPRLDLTKSSSLITYLPQFGAIKTVFGVDLLELLLMASKVAYENAAVVEYAVTKRWKVGLSHFSVNCIV